MGELPPLLDSVGPLLEAVDGLTMREASPPPIFLFGGNSGSVFEHIRRGGLDQPGVDVFDWDLTGLAAGVSPVVGLDDRVEAVVGRSDVQEKVVSALGAGADALGHGLIEFALSLGSLGQSILRAWSESRSSLGAISPVIDLLDGIRDRHLAAVLCLGELGEDERRIVWDSVLSWSRTAASHENRLLVIAGIDRAYRSDPMVEKNTDSYLLRSARTAIEHDRVQWTWLEPLSDDRVGSWLGPVEESVREALVAMSGRDDLVAARLWQLWTDAGHVELADDGEWRQTDRPEPFRQSIDALLADRVGELGVAPWDVRDPRQLAEDALEFAALGGATFSRSVVAERVAGNLNSVERGDVEDLLDRLGEDDDGRWMVDTDGTSTVVRGERFWRYVFASPWIAQAFRATLEARGTVGSNLVPVAHMADRLLETADLLHGPDPLFEDWLFKLAVTAGNTDRIRFHERRRSAEADRRTLAARAIVFLSVPEHDVVTLDEQVSLITDLTSIRSLDLAIQLGLKLVADTASIGTEHQQARSEINTGRAYDWNDDPNHALPLLHSGTTRAQKLHDADPASVVYQRHLAIALKELGVAVRNAGRAADAIDPLERSTALREGLLAADPTSVVYQRDLAIGLGELGVAVRNAGRAADAIDPLERSTALYEGLLAADPTSVVYQRDLAIALKDLGVAVRDAGRAADAIELSERSTALHEGLLAVDPTSVVYQRELAIALKELGVAVRDAGRAADAIDPLERSTALREGLLAADPTSVVYQRELAIALKDLGVAVRDAGRAADAIELSERSTARHEGLLAADPTSVVYQRDLAIALKELGVAVRDAGRAADAIDPLERSTALREGLLAADPTSVVYQRDLEAAVDALRQARQSEPPNS